MWLEIRITSHVLQRLPISDVSTKGLVDQFLSLGCIGAQKQFQILRMKLTSREFLLDRVDQRIRVHIAVTLCKRASMIVKTHTLGDFQLRVNTDRSGYGRISLFAYVLSKNYNASQFPIHVCLLRWHWSNFGDEIITTFPLNSKRLIFQVAEKYV